MEKMLNIGYDFDFFLMRLVVLGMKKIYFALLSAIILLCCGACSRNTSVWTLRDAEVNVRRGETVSLPFEGGTGTYDITAQSPDVAMAVVRLSAEGAAADTIHISGCAKGISDVTVRDCGSHQVVCLRVRVVEPYMALLGCEHVDPGRQDALMAWDTNLYLSSDGKYILTTFTDGLPIKPSLLDRGTYEAVRDEAGNYRLTFSPEVTRGGRRSFDVKAASALAETLDSWDLGRPDSDFDMCEMTNTAVGTTARYRLSMAEHLPSGMLL